MKPVEPEQPKGK